MSDHPIPKEYGEHAKEEKGVAVVGPDAVRYVLFNEAKGIFLGNDALGNMDWSYEGNSSLHDRATTYLKFQADRVVAYFKEKFNLVVTKHEVKPDKKFGLASIEACVAAGLPRWEFDLERYVGVHGEKARIKKE